MKDSEKRRREQVQKELSSLYVRVIAEANLNPAERELYNLERLARRESMAKVFG